MTATDNLICEMLTENTGKHFLDSGGANGRNWQRNQGLTPDVLDSLPSATLEISEWDGEYELIPTINLYHFLTQQLDLDALCEEFNSAPVEDWDGPAYGVSEAGGDWLTANGFELGNTHNSYNWESSLSQVIQWTEATRDGEEYILLQIHGGADVRGGYTDARLFLKDSYEAFGICEDCGFGVETDSGEILSLSWRGEWIDQDGSPAYEEYKTAFAKASGCDEDSGSIVIEGDCYIG